LKVQVPLLADQKFVFLLSSPDFLFIAKSFASLASGKMSTISSITSLGSGTRRSTSRNRSVEQPVIVENDEEMPDVSSVRSQLDNVHNLTPGPTRTESPEVLSNPRRRVVLHNFDGISLDTLPRLLLTDIWSSDCDVVLKTLETIGEMCRSGDDEDPTRERIVETNRKIVRQAGGHLALVMSMRRWSRSNSIQAEGCFVLGAAGMDSSFTKAAVEVGAIGAVLSAMRNFADDEAVQLYACGALLVISLENKETARHLVVDLKALETIIAALHRFPNSTDIEDLACQIFLSLSEWTELKGILVKSGAIRALGTVFERYASDDIGGSLSDSKTVEEMAKETIRRLLGL
jgi:hypothetical protein